MGKLYKYRQTKIRHEIMKFKVECEENCRKTENCVGFVLNRYGSYCVLKSSKGYPQGHSRNQRFISGFLIDDKVKISISNETRLKSVEWSEIFSQYFFSIKACFSIMEICLTSIIAGNLIVREAVLSGSLTVVTKLKNVSLGSNKMLKM